MRQGAARVGRAAIAALAFGLASPQAVAQVGDFPVTAYSRSLNMQSEFVDETSLLFVYPQRAGTLSTRFLALGVESYTLPNGVGFHGNGRGCGGFLLVNEAPVVGEEPVFQAGGGVAWKLFRVGVAARAGRDENERVSYQAYQDEFSNRVYVNYEALEMTLYQGALGVGVGGERAGLDLALEGQRADVKFARVEASQDTLAQYFETDGEHDFGYSGRFHVRLGGDTELVGVGGWGNMIMNLDGQELFMNRITKAKHSLDFENWHGGLAVSFATAKLDWLAFAAHWRHREVPTDFRYSGLLNRSISVRREITISLRQKLWRELRGAAGVGMAYQEQTNVSGQRDPQRLYYNEYRTTTMRGEFAWGVSYVWRLVDVRSAVRTNFPAGDLFASLDLIVHL